ncbi:helicase SNF2 [Streptococcus parasuis]|uniref:helicase SNF2 n=1 Tax=Streptococcus parasuis TaxID=1501662 RepID=UPI0029652840|nr:helicase SNF2 [Streptococcus parasuis]
MKSLQIYQIKKHLVVSIRNKDIDALNAATISNKLLQMACSSVYDEDQNMIRIHDIKLDALEDLIEGTNGKPVLIAY